jgi:GH15 family glucan-1,4-alpha-glucosidase
MNRAPRRIASVSFAAASLVFGSLSHAQVSPISIVEHGLGASPLYMVAGHGRLTVGVTRESDIAVLAWPTPSCCDQLTHLASNDPTARSEPRTGVREGFGIALALVIEDPSGTRVRWFHDGATFTPSPGYLDDVSLQPTTTLEDAADGLTVTVRDAVLPDADVLQRAITVTREPGSHVMNVRLLVHANLGLTENVVSRVPVGDVVGDARNDFGAIVHPDGVVHFRPRDRGRVTEIVPLLMPQPYPADYFGPLDDLMRMNGDVSTAAADLAAHLDTAFPGPGVYAIVSTEPRATQVQVGRETDRFCQELGHLVDNVVALADAGVPLPLAPSTAQAFRCADMVLPANVASARGWTRAIESAWDDAQDGTLSGNPVAAYLNDSAQRVDLSFMGNVATARVFVAFGSTIAEAHTAYATGSALTADAFAQRDHDAWTAYASGLLLPDTLPDTIAPADRDAIVRITRRAFLHIANGTDAATGAIVASIARQAPYGLDWPRDGAFFDYGLDVVGNHAAVTRRLAWALPLARTMPLTSGDLNPLVDPAPPVDPRNGHRQYPESAWEMNYYNDGTMGGFYRFEIDNTAWMIWSAAVHVAYVDEPERMQLAISYWPRVEASADLLAAWRDPATGLNAPANEDDNAAFTSGLHGGTAVFASLEAAARLARYLRHDDIAARWETRAGELRDALVAAFYDEAQGRFVNDVSGGATTNPGSSSLGPTAWLVWPAHLLPYEDPRVAAQVRYDLGEVLSTLRGDPGYDGGAYLTKNTLAAAMFLANGGDPSLRPLLEDAMVRLARDVISPDTQVMGEVFVTLRDADGGVMRRENRVSIPHLWEATLFSMTALAMAHPDRFDLDRRLLPPNQTPPVGTAWHPDAGVMPMDAGRPRMDAGTGAGPGNAHLGGGLCGCRVVGARTRTTPLHALLAALATSCMLGRRRRNPRRRGTLC